MRSRGIFALYQKGTCEGGESDFYCSVEKGYFLVSSVSERREGFMNLDKAYGYRSSDGVYECM